jgi:hypothetical protein
LVCLSFLKCCAPYTGGSTSALSQFFPVDFGLRPIMLARLFRKRSHQTASRGRTFSIRQAFLYVAALQFACPPNRSAPPTGTRGRVTPELAVDSLPPRQSGMLPGRLVNCRDWTFTSKKGSRCRLHHNIVTEERGQLAPRRPSPGLAGGACGAARDGRDS